MAIADTSNPLPIPLRPYSFQCVPLNFQLPVSVSLCRKALSELLKGCSVPMQQARSSGELIHALQPPTHVCCDMVYKYPSCLPTCV